MRTALAVHDPPIWILPRAEVARIRAALPEHDVREATGEGERRDLFRTADVVVTTWMSEAEAALLDAARWVHSTAVGVGGLVRRGVLDRGIPVTNSRGVHAQPVAEHAMAMVFALTRGLHVARARQLERVWAQDELFEGRARPLSDMCLLVVGLGAIGCRVAALAAGLGMRVLGVRARPELAKPPGVDVVVPAAQLREAIRTADVVVLAAPHTHGTRAMIGAAELALMRPSAVLVNVARGALVDEAALVDALEHGHIAGAGLDAFAREPLPMDSPLWRLPNVIVTPHSASFQADYWRPTVDLFLDNMGRFVRGEPLLNVVDPDLGY